MPILNADGSIRNAKVLAAYERICGPRREDGRTRSASKVDSAEAFLRLVCRMSPQQLKTWGFI